MVFSNNGTDDLLCIVSLASVSLLHEGNGMMIVMAAGNRSWTYNTIDFILEDETIRWKNNMMVCDYFVIMLLSNYD